MSKIKICKVCSKEVAKSAKVCPYCGAKLKMSFIKKIGICIGIMTIILIISSALSNNDSNTSTASKNSTETAESKNAKTEWNTTETDIEKNDNMTTAVNLIKSNSDLRSNATMPDPASVAKSPFKYYGKVVKITGEIGDIQEYAPGSDWSKNLGGSDAGQIVITSDDGTITDMFFVGSTNNLKNGDTVSLYGYPIGLTEVDNKSGGKTIQLAVVGNSYDKQ